MHKILTSVLLAVFLAACGSGGSSVDLGPGEVAKSSKERDTSPDVSAEDLQALTSDNAAFAWELYQEVTKPGKNLFFSPYSLSVALAMTWAGARGTSETQMANTMHFTLGQEGLHPAFNALDLALASRAESSGPDAPLPFRLEVTNALFGQTGFPFLDPFLDTLAVNYGAGMNLLDFMNEPDPSRIVINQWVSDRTEERIEELIAEGIITPATRLVLVNAIYFTASWLDPFDEANTTDEGFDAPSGEVTVPTMHHSIRTIYGEGEGYAAAELPYDGNDLAMLVILPDEGEFDAVEAALSANKVDEIRDGLSDHQVEVAFPKFSFRSAVPAKQPLIDLGMVDPFGGGADLSGMTDAAQLFIQDVVHQAFVAVDEKGTEAAAATAVIVGETSAPPPATLTVDRPFIFAIIDRPTGALLFAGRVLDPTAS